MTSNGADEHAQPLTAPMTAPDQATIIPFVLATTYGTCVGAGMGAVTAPLLNLGECSCGRVLVFAGALAGALVATQAMAPNTGTVFAHGACVFSIWLAVFAMYEGVLAGAAAGFMTGVVCTAVIVLAVRRRYAGWYQPF